MLLEDFPEKGASRSFICYHVPTSTTSLGPTYQGQDRLFSFEMDELETERPTAFLLPGQSQTVCLGLHFGTKGRLW